MTGLDVIKPRLEIATITVANATKASTLVTKNYPLVATLASSFVEKKVNKFISNLG